MLIMTIVGNKLPKVEAGNYNNKTQKWQFSQKFEWASLRGDRMFPEVNRVFHKVDRIFPEVDRMFPEADQMFPEVDRMFPEVERMYT
jgi:hypothetical protein